MNNTDIYAAAQMAASILRGNTDIISVSQSQFNAMDHVSGKVYIIFPDAAAPASHSMSMQAEPEVKEDADEY